MKNWGFRPLVALALTAGLCSIHAGNVIWTNTSGGNWSVGANWNPNHAPGSSDIAIITNSGNYTVTLDVSTNVSGLVLGTTNSGTTQTLSINGQTFTLAGQATVKSGGQFNLSSGIFKGNASGGGAVFNGTLICSGGSLAGSLTMASNSVLSLTGTAALNAFNGLMLLTNYGTVIWSNTDIDATGNLEIYNYGLWDAQTNNTFHGSYSGGGNTTFNNYGTFRKSGGTTFDSGIDTELDYNTTFNNYGTVDNQAGRPNQGALLEFVNGNCTSSGTFNNTYPSTTECSGGCALTGNPTFTGNGWVNGNFNGNNALVQGVWATDRSTLSGTLTIASNAVLNFITPTFPGGMVTLQSTILTNYGMVLWTCDDLRCQSSPQIYNYGLWDDQTNNTLSGAVFNNYGTFRKSGGAGGNSVLDSNTTFNNPGTLDVQTGLLNLNGNYALAGGTLNFGINGSGDYGSISLAGTAALAGKLSVNLNNGYSPVAGSSFALLGYGSETGMFTATSLPHLSELIWQSNYGVTSFTLNLMNLPPMQLSPATALNGSSISFSWGGFDGQTYQVQCTTNLSPANWFNIGNPIPGTNGTTTVSDAFGSSPQKFYRVVSPP